MVKPPFYPTPPPKGASRLDHLLFLRKNYIYEATLTLPVLVLGLVLSPKVVIVICVTGWVLQGIDAATLELHPGRTPKDDRLTRARLAVSYAALAATSMPSEYPARLVSGVSVAMDNRTLRRPHRGESAPAARVSATQGSPNFGRRPERPPIPQA